MSAVHASAHAELPRAILLRVFLRSLVLQASWNRRGMQNLGVAYALWPALEWLHPDERSRARAAARHLGFFNTHPYLASAILGGVLFHEARVARGEEPAESVEQFKQALMGPFAAVGDSFFWLSLRPFAGVAAAVSAPLIGLWAVPLFLGLYDVPHLALRARLFLLGYRSGDRVVESVARFGLPKRGARLRAGSALLAGGAAALSLFSLERRDVALPLGAVAVLAAFSASYAIFGRAGALTSGGIALVLGILLSLFRSAGG